MRDNILYIPNLSNRFPVTKPQIINAMASDLYGNFQLFDYIALSPRIRHKKETI